MNENQRNENILVGNEGGRDRFCPIHDDNAGAVGVGTGTGPASKGVAGGGCGGQGHASAEIVTGRAGQAAVDAARIAGDRAQAVLADR